MNRKLIKTCILAIIVGLPYTQCLSAIQLFNQTDDGNLVTSSTGATNFTFNSGFGWQVSNSSEPDVIVSLTSPLLVVDDFFVTILLEHSFRFEYSLDGSVPSSSGDAFDGANMELSINGGTFTLFEDWDFDGYTLDQDGVNGLNASPGWSHEGSKNSGVIINSLNVGDTLQMRFNAGWDSSVFEAPPNWTLRRLELDGLTTVVPEPSTVFFIFAAGLVSMIYRRRNQ